MSKKINKTYPKVKSTLLTLNQDAFFGAYVLQP